MHSRRSLPCAIAHRPEIDIWPVLAHTIWLSFVKLAILKGKLAGPACVLPFLFPSLPSGGQRPGPNEEEGNPILAPGAKSSTSAADSAQRERGSGPTSTPPARGNRLAWSVP